MNMINKERFFSNVNILLLCFSGIVPAIVLAANFLLGFSTYKTTFSIIDLWAYLIIPAGYICLAVNAFFIAIQKRKTIKIVNVIRRHLVLSFLIMLLLWTIAASFFCSDQLTAIIGLDGYFEGIISFISLLGFFLAGYFILKKDLIKIYLWFFMFGDAVTVFSIFIKNKELNRFLNLSKDLASGIFVNSNFSCYYICLGLMTAASLFLLSDRKHLKVISFTFFIFFTVTQLQNNSFGPYLAEIIGLAVLVLCCALKNKNDVANQEKWNKNHFKDSIVLIITFAIISIIYTLMFGFLMTDFTKLSPDFQNLFSKNEKVSDRVGSGRGILWKHAIQFIIERPIFGCGQANIFSLFKKYKISNTAVHCEPLNIAVGEGIPALILYLSSLMAYFLQYLKKFKSLEIIDICLFCIGTAYLASSLVGMSVYNVTPYFSIIFGFAAGRIESWHINGASSLES